MILFSMFLIATANTETATTATSSISPPESISAESAATNASAATRNSGPTNGSAAAFPTRLPDGKEVEQNQPQDSVLY